MKAYPTHFYFIAILCHSWSTNAFQSQSKCPCPSRHGPSLLPRGMKSSSSSSSTGDRDERIRVRFDQASTSQTPYISADGRSRKTSLSVATLGDGVDRRTSFSIPDISAYTGRDHDVDAVTKVLSASLLVTSNTVGPSMFTLPEAVAGVGMMWGTAIFFGELRMQ